MGGWGWVWGDGDGGGGGPRLRCPLLSAGPRGKQLGAAGAGLLLTLLTCRLHALHSLLTVLGTGLLLRLAPRYTGPGAAGLAPGPGLRLWPDRGGVASLLPFPCPRLLRLLKPSGSYSPHNKYLM